MHRLRGHCSGLIEKTAAALDEDTVALMLLAVQRDNLELSVKVALDRWVYQLNIEMVDHLDKYNSVYPGVGFKFKPTKGIVQECLRAFPYLWVSVVTVLFVTDAS